MKAVILPLHPDDKIQLRSGIDFRNTWELPLEPSPEFPEPDPEYPMTKVLLKHWAAIEGKELK